MICEILPFESGIDKPLEYYCPIELMSDAAVGKRVVIPIKTRIATGIILNIKNESSYDGKLKRIIDIIDDEPILEKIHIDFSKWISEFYMSPLSETIKNYSPTSGEIKSKKYIIADKKKCLELLNDEKDENSARYQALRILSEKEKISLNYLGKIIKAKNIYSLTRGLKRQRAVIIEEEIEEKEIKRKTKKIAKLALSKDVAFGLVGELEKRSPKQALTIAYLIGKKDCEEEISNLIKKAEITSSTIKSLAEKGIVRIIEKEENRADEVLYSEIIKEIELSDEQKIAASKIVASIKENQFKTFLIKGVTGSGKTQVYIECAKEVIRMGKNAIIMAPEISLTPQIYARLKNEFGEICVLAHSKMSPAKRYDAWRGIRSGKYKILVGPRSVIFYPMTNVGLIVVDEEHEISYKQWETQPRYQARDCAVVLGKLHNCPVVLGSATPSIESYYNAIKGKYELIELKKRIKEAKLPEVKLVNLLAQKKMKKVEGSLSLILIEEIRKRLEKKEQVILFKNRRGFSTNLVCENCGYSAVCDNCSVNLTYHIKIDKLLCHHCGYSKKPYEICPLCASKELKYFGVGTQKLEDELSFHFREAKIERIDSDAVIRKGKLESILEKFKKGEIDILVGTQMVAKGLDFENVTLVGVALADAGLWTADFRASERTFQLLTQVAGRSGRGEKKGEVLIQTYNPNHPAIQFAAFGEIEKFYDYELNLRQKFLYPPFSRLTLIEFKSKDKEKAEHSSEDFFKYLCEADGDRVLIIPKPYPAAIFKLKNFYRMQILIKSPKEKDPSGKELRRIIEEAYFNYNKKSLFSSVKPLIDVDPYVF